MLDNTTDHNEKENIEETSTSQADTHKIEQSQKKLQEPEADDLVNAGEAQDDDEAVEEKKVDYSKHDLEALVLALQKLIKNEPVQKIKDDVDAIKTNFNKKFGALLETKKKAFLAEGGNEIDFQYNFPLKSQYNDLLFEFKVKRDQHYKEQQAILKENLSKRLTLIEELKTLINNAEPSTMYNEFKVLQERWREVGKIPHTKYNDVWRTYHHHVERFYDLLHLSNDFRDLDFKHNLDEKEKLIERAEALIEEPDANKAFKELQVLHRLWKEDVGPVAREHREDVWQRFSDATRKIHDRRHEALKELEAKYEVNFDKKLEVVQAIKDLVKEATDSHADWQKRIKSLEKYRQEFFKLGRVPRSKNNQIWTAFKEATKKFNREKNAFYKEVKKVQQENLNQKLELVDRAESLKDSEDWDQVTPIMKQIQQDWKTIGHVPKKYSDEIWKRFKDACNHYFNRLHGVQDEANKDQIDVFNKKKDLLENLKSQADSGDKLTLELVQAYTDDWKKLGAVPHSMRHIEAKFNKVLDKLYEKLDMSKEAIAMLKFKAIVDGYHTNNDIRKLDNEQLFVRKKIDEVTREIQQLENNISFISSADDDNPLLQNVRNTITSYQEDLSIWQKKLDYLMGLEY